MTAEHKRHRGASNRVLLVWLIVTVVIWLTGWWASASLIGVDLLPGLGGPATPDGGAFNGKPWAGIVGFVCLLPAAVVAFRGRRRLGLILVGFVTVYVTALVLFWTEASPAIWGPYRYTYSADQAGETACWKQVPGLADLPDAEVQALGAVSATDIWAVGQDFDSERSLTVHWDGKTLRQVANPGADELYAVAAVAPRDAWAAGGATKPLVEHWNGTSWRVLSTPRLPKARFEGIGARSGTDVWAVGSVNHPRNPGPHPLIEHWDGTTWTVVLPRTSSGYLRGVAARAADDAWAVGGQGGRALIVHWDGRAWGRIVGPKTGKRGRLNDVAALSATNAWAVGTSAGKTLIQHWDGRRWRVVRRVNRGQTTSLQNISALSPTDIWASGGETEDPWAPLLEHWDGRRWQMAPVPDWDGGFSALVAVTPNEIWGDVNVVGFISPDVPFIERSSCSGERGGDGA
jgi:hypothetical protein